MPPRAPSPHFYTRELLYDGFRLKPTRRMTDGVPMKSCEASWRVANRLPGWVPVLACLTLHLTSCAKAPEAPVTLPAYAVPFHIIAHRGASAYAPENTLPAFEIAHRLGAFEVELDVMLSADDTVVLFHDAQMSEKTNRTGIVRDYTLTELRETDIGTWFDATHPEVETLYSGTGLISLKTLFEVMGHSLYYHVELKSGDADLPRQTLKVIEEADLGDRVMVTSFRLEQLQRFRALNTTIPIGWLLEGAYLEGIDQAVTEGFQQVGIPARDLTPRNVSMARSRGLEARAWLIQSDPDMKRAIRLGANGMTTNWPDRLIAQMVRDMGATGNAASH